MSATERIATVNGYATRIHPADTDASATLVALRAAFKALVRECCLWALDTTPLASRPSANLSAAANALAAAERAATPAENYVLSREEKIHTNEVRAELGLDPL